MKKLDIISTNIRVDSLSWLYSLLKQVNPPIKPPVLTPIQYGLFLKNFQVRGVGGGRNRCFLLNYDKLWHAYIILGVFSKITEL